MASNICNYAKSEKHLDGDAQHQGLHVVGETVHVHLLLVANHLSVSVFLIIIYGSISREKNLG